MNEKRIKTGEGEEKMELSVPEENASTAPTMARADSSAQVGSLYTCDELAAQSAPWDATPDLIRAALKIAGRTMYTVQDAKRIVEAFQRQEVR